MKVVCSNEKKNKKKLDKILIMRKYNQTDRPAQKNK